MTNVRSLDAALLLRQRKRLRRELLEAAGLRPLRIAVLGGTTTSEVVDLLELLLLGDGFEPTFYQSDYNRFYEEATLDSQRVADFKPDIVVVATHLPNLSRLPPAPSGDGQLGNRVLDELERYKRVWQALFSRAKCQVIQNNFELPPWPVMGNLDGVSPAGHTRFVSELNREFAACAHADGRLLIHDIHALSARIGLLHWFDWERWYSYRLLTTPEASLAIARSLAGIIGAARGRARKLLAVDLDNTCWGGVIGDDGVDKLHIGKETPLAEAYTAFQHYLLSLRARGVLLAACSKNDDAVARTGFDHPDSVLQAAHFCSFKANWQPKHENLQAMAEELGLGLDSFVFVDDNPAERALVRAQLPMVAVPEMGDDVSRYPAVLHAGGHFEMTALCAEDLQRAEAYSANAARSVARSQFASYGDYLDSLAMTAEIADIKPVYLERIAQLVNKTNQFNLTNRRYAAADIRHMATDPDCVVLYGRLADAFGDNGLVSVVIARQQNEVAHIDLWIMSCRVLKRDMELAMLDALVARCRSRGVRRLRGHYDRSPRNGMVADHYRNLGFVADPSGDNGQDHSSWLLDLAAYSPRNTHIKVSTPWTEAASSGS